MDEKNENIESDYKPDITNYDYVWGSDQSEYVKENATTADKSDEDLTN
ncbi:hypothetical protein [Paenibacillus aceris]|uniref:DUF4025 domain-containing protein n=1 Tax=Paenibacillus aceris TaxID=869555 RepID=A0ABS4HRF1_9BACL|nr:hypothetical protein [Paenibacillus aceris]MBP1961198.1 hypothetical protein [Paenibacillus aceris]NHW38013.1 hypothetical protein [Paenibacillus aceris]